MAYIICDMPWGAIETEPEVYEWLTALTLPEFARATFYIDLLEAEGVHLDEPYSRQLRGKLRELRFYLGRQQVRTSYYIATGRRIILLTVFAKQSRRETREIERAETAMETCIREKHAAPEEA